MNPLKKIPVLSFATLVIISSTAFARPSVCTVRTHQRWSPKVEITQTTKELADFSERACVEYACELATESPAVERIAQGRLEEKRGSWKDINRSASFVLDSHCKAHPYLASGDSRLQRYRSEDLNDRVVNLKTYWVRDVKAESLSWQRYGYHSKLLIREAGVNTILTYRADGISEFDPLAAAINHRLGSMDQNAKIYLLPQDSFSAEKRTSTGFFPFGTID